MREKKGREEGREEEKKGGREGGKKGAQLKMTYFLKKIYGPMFIASTQKYN